MNKWFICIVFYALLLLGYSRFWFFRDFVIFRKDISASLTPWFLSVLLSIPLVGIIKYALSEGNAHRKIKFLFQKISAPSPKKWILWISLMAISLRILWLIYSVISNPHIFYDMLPEGSRYNVVMAKQLISGHGYTWNGTAVCIRPPGYAFLTSVAFSLFDIENPWPMLSLNLLASLGIVLFAYKIAKYLFGETVGRTTSILAAFSWPEIYQVCFLLEETIFTFLFLAASYLMISQKRGLHPILIIAVSSLFWLTFVFGYFSFPAIVGVLVLILLALAAWRFPHWNNVLGTGVLVGFTCYFRPTLVLLPLLLPIVYRLQRFSVKIVLQRSTIVLITVLLTISPWVIRNSFANKTFTFLSTNGGGTFFENNIELCKKDRDFAKFVKKDNQLVDLYTMVSREQADRTININQGESDRELAKYTLRCIFRYPVDFLRIAWKRTLQFFLNANQVIVNMIFLEISKQELGWGWYAYFLAQVLNVWFYGLSLFLFGIGIFQTFRNQHEKLTLLIPFFYMFLFLLVFTPQVRYRLPICTFIYVYAAFGSTQLISNTLGARVRFSTPTEVTTTMSSNRIPPASK